MFARVKDLEFARMQIEVRDTKGKQDRYTMFRIPSPSMLSTAEGFHFDGVNERPLSFISSFQRLWR